MKEKILKGLMNLVLKITIYLNKNKIKTDGCFRTFMGIKFDLKNPTPEMYNEIDFIKGISYQGHYGGQTQYFYSIAEHLLLTEYIYGQKNPLDYIGRLAALLHDGQESFYHDMLKPLKDMLPNYEYLEKNAQKVLFEKYNIPLEYMQKIKWADIEAQKQEASVFFKNQNNKNIYFYPPQMSFDKYKETLDYLKYKVNEKI